MRFTTEDGSNQEGVYWRYEMAVRELESRVGDVTAGNGALYATRRDSYVVVDPRMGHDLSFPFNMVKRGWRAKYEPSATATEKTTPSNESEFRRKRRMMSHTWPIMLTGGILDPRGYSPLYAFEIVSHRLLRYVTPFLHVIALVTSIRLRYRAALGGQRRPRSCSPPAPAFGGGGPAVQARALLRARHRVARGRPLRLPAHRHARRLGEGRGHAMIARALDLVVASVALLVSSPFLLVATIAIRVESPGSPIYRQRRIGRDGEPFEMLKLRTMVSGAEHHGAGMAVNYGDPRITRVGHVPAPLLDRRAAEPRERAARRDVGGRAAPDDPGAGRPVHADCSAAASR